MQTLAALKYYPTRVSFSLLPSQGPSVVSAEALSWLGVLTVGRLNGNPPPKDVLIPRTRDGTSFQKKISFFQCN